MNQQILHAFGDSYAHVTAEGGHFIPVVGHLFKWTAPDEPDKHKGAYSKYVSAIYEIASVGTGKARRDASYVDDLAVRVSSVAGADVQKRILDDSAALIMDEWSSGLVNSPVKDCEFLSNCNNRNPANTINPVIREVYGLDRQAPVSPVIDWSGFPWR